MGVHKTKKAKSPTGKPSALSSAGKKLKAGDFSGGAPVKPKKAKKKAKAKMQKGTIPRVEDALRRSGA